MKYKGLLYDKLAQKRHTVEVNATGFRDAREQILRAHGQEALSVWTVEQVLSMEAELAQAGHSSIRQHLMDIATEAVLTVATEADKVGATIA